MLKKRIIGVITICNGIAIQSCGYKSYLPLGNPLIIAENLDRWGVDEILLQNIDRTKKKLGPDLLLLEKIKKFNISTPVIYSGGINSFEDSQAVIQSGADRICIDSLIINDLKMVKKISSKVGSQALIASLPVTIINKAINHFNYLSNEYSLAMPLIIKILKENIFSEFFITDFRHEGVFNGFDRNILKHLSIIDTPLILFGGITNENFIKLALANKNISAIAIGNMFNYKEHSLQKLKERVNSHMLRKPIFSGKDFT